MYQPVFENNTSKCISLILRHKPETIGITLDEHGWANQGHSIPVDVELPVTEPPEYLYHGTGQKYVEAIDRTGLIPKSRLYVRDFWRNLL